MKHISIVVLPLFVFRSNAQQLFIAINYHPHDDKNVETWKRDIQLMNNAGFKVVRVVHLA